MHHEWDSILPIASNKRSKSVQAHQNNPSWEQCTRRLPKNDHPRMLRDGVCTHRRSAQPVQMLYSGASGAPIWRAKGARGAGLGWCRSLSMLRDRPDRARRKRVRSVAWCALRLRPEGTPARAGAARLRRGAPAISRYLFGADDDRGEGLTPDRPPNSVRPHQSDTRKRDTQTWLNAVSRRARYSCSGRRGARHFKAAFALTPPTSLSSKWRTEVQLL